MGEHIDDGFAINIVRSRRRRKTVSAHMVKDVMHLHVPYAMSEVDVSTYTKEFKQRFLRKRRRERLNQEQDLGDIAERLNKKYFDGLLPRASIEYVSNQHARFGSCYYNDGIIRISDCLGDMPTWVRDYVIVHEMAHLIEPHHNKVFWSLVNHYPLAERARGFLIAKGLEMQEEDMLSAEPTT